MGHNSMVVSKMQIFQLSGNCKALNNFLKNKCNYCNSPRILDFFATKT